MTLLLTLEVSDVTETPMILNLFGGAFTALVWGLLIAVNLWCFYQVCKGAGTCDPKSL
jgi:hypothetical protein